MKQMKRLTVAALLLFALSSLYAEEGEKKSNKLLLDAEVDVPAYTLPDPLVCSDGSAVKTPDDWFAKRRPELLKLFQEEMYGRMPSAACANLAWETLETKADALGGKATRKQIRLFFNAPEKEPSLDLLIFIPNGRTGAVPAFLGLNFKGNQATTDDTAIVTAPRLSGSRFPEAETPHERGASKSRWAYEKIIDAGYAVVTGYYEQIEPDRPGFDRGVHLLFAKEFPDSDAGNYPSTITAWAWGLSRVLDMLTTAAPEIDAKKVIVFGHSRLGKTALWTAANDERFAAAVSNDSGCGGAALARRRIGEKYEFMFKTFPHWFCKNFRQYSDKENEIPFDQHELVALIAPRPVYIASASLDLWADPKGEFLSGLGADPVYRLLGTDGIGGCAEWPEIEQPVGKTIRYHLRNGKHDVTDYDWTEFIRFADETVR